MSVTFSIFIFFQNVRFCMFSLYYLVFCFCAFRATELLNAGFFRHCVRHFLYFNFILRLHIFNGIIL